MKLKNVHIDNLDQFHGLSNVTVCSVRGSTIRSAVVESAVVGGGSDVYALEMASRYRFL